MLTDADIGYSVCGGVAVCLHGYQRNTLDLDLIIHADDTSKVKELFEKSGLTWDEKAAEFRTESGIAVQFLIAGYRAEKGYQIKLPDPEGKDNIETIDGLPVLRLSKLIEVKLACGLGNIRRTHKDLADVVELIVIRKLDGSFSRHLHKSVRDSFCKLVRNSRGEE